MDVLDLSLNTLQAKHVHTKRHLLIHVHQIEKYIISFLSKIGH